jgi:hypothetical protein
VSARNRLLAACALVAWGLLLAVEQPWRGDAHERTAAAVRPLFADFARRRDAVRRAEIRAGADAVVLEWRNDRWWVVAKEHPADLRKLVQVVDMVGRLDTRDEVATSAASHAQYGVAGGEGTRITLSDGEGAIVADLIVGKLRQQDVTTGQNPVLEFYVRRADRAAVHLSGDAISPSADPIQWCETRFLAAITPEEIEWVRREDFETGESWRVERVPTAQAEAFGSTWKLVEPLPERAAWDFAGDSLVRTLLDLQAADVAGRAGDPAEDAARCGFPTDRFHVSARGSVLRFELGKPAREGQRWLRVEGLPYLYTLRDFDVSQLRQPVADMLPQADDE